MYKAMGMLLSVFEFFGAMMEAYKGLSATHTKVKSVLNWKWWLGTDKASKDRCCINKKGMKGLRTQRIDGEKHGVGALWIHKVEGRVVLHYKEYSTDELWLPFKRGADGEVLKPLQTDDAGIPIFTRDPVGGKASMVEAELHTVEVQARAQASAQRCDSSDDSSDDLSDGERVCAPVRGKGKAKAQAGTSHSGGQHIRGQRDEGGEGEADTERLRKAPPLNIKGVVEAVRKLAVAVKQGGYDLFTPEHIADWDRWAEETPTSLADIPEGEHACLDLFPPFQPSAEPSSRPAREQIELMGWADFQEASRGVSKGQLERERRERSAMTISDVDTGKLVIFRSQPVAADEQLPNLPFWAGTVLSKSETTLRLHWHFPFQNSQPTTDVNAKWKPLCIGRHPWTAACSAGHCGTPLAIQSTARGPERTKWVYEFEVEEVVLANQKLNTDGALSVKLMRDIVRAAEDLEKTILLDETSKRPTLVVSDRCLPCNEDVEMST
jgi:hypothetical protein